MKVLVCGGRDYANLDAVMIAIRKLSPRPSHIIHGSAMGADALAGEAAAKLGIQDVRCPANWGLHGRRAGPIRNHNMLELHPDLVLAFPGGNGTAHMCKIARQRGIQVRRCG